MRERLRVCKVIHGNPIERGIVYACLKDLSSNTTEAIYGDADSHNEFCPFKV
jgi:hypothetical protein